MFQSILKMVKMKTTIHFHLNVFLTTLTLAGTPKARLSGESLTAIKRPCSVGILNINAVNTLSCFSRTYSKTENSKKALLVITCA